MTDDIPIIDNIEIVRGSAFCKIYTFSYDISNYTYTSKVLKISDQSVVATLSVSQNNASKQVTLLLTSTVTAALDLYDKGLTFYLQQISNSYEQDVVLGSVIVRDRR